ncbi:MAG: DUF2059 domain-containing protein [Chthoniobacterales bacterium]|nr:DUF2059 domain-containing protein [Chthoniobacterales bacterium]
MKIRLLLVFLSCLLVPSAIRAQGLADTPENRKQQAQRYLEATPPALLFQEVADKGAAQLPPSEQEKYKQAFLAQVETSTVQQSLTDALVKHFSAGELKALADFYGSGTGKAAMSKLGSYMSDITPTIQFQMRRAQAAGDQSILSK